MARIEVEVEGIKKISFEMDGEPHSEKDLLSNKAYQEFYYSVGLGAPVTVVVTTNRGILKKERYTFNFKIKGNSISRDEFTDMLSDSNINKIATAEALNVIGNVMRYVYSFPTYESANIVYHKFENICNIGAYQLKQDGKDLLILEYHPVID